jgi:predicted dinucleotide-utilizing enzyme
LPNGERRLIAEDVPGTDIARLPEGRYWVESIYGASNAVVSAEIEVKAGQLMEATFRHHAATLTLKLVNQAGGEALANTSWSILTPGGDVIRESIGAFPSMVLAEGQYTVVARHEGRVFQR